MEEKDIKIGRVNRGVEKSLDLALPNDVSIFMLENELNHLARKRPEDYLVVIDRIKEIIKEPDYVSYLEKEDKILYLKEYEKDGKTAKAILEIRHDGRPKKWIFSRLYCPNEETLSKALFKRFHR